MTHCVRPIEIDLRNRYIENLTYNTLLTTNLEKSLLRKSVVTVTLRRASV